MKENRPGKPSQVEGRRDPVGDPNERCSVCGRRGLEKACGRCVKKYGRQFDLTTADGRYLARVAEQGTSDDRWRQDEDNLAIQRAKTDQDLQRLTDKLGTALKAAKIRDFSSLTTSLKGVERLGKKIARGY